MQDQIKKKDWALFQIQKDFLNQLHRELPSNLNITLLKGAGFIHRLDQDRPLRAMSDIDFFCPLKQWPDLNTFLSGMGFQKLETKRAKALWSKTLYDMEIIIEVHGLIGPNILSWQKDLEFIAHPFWPKFKVLEKHSEFIYLCWHYAFQHTLLEEKWALDLVYFHQHFAPFSSKKLLDLAINAKMLRSFDLCLTILQQQYSVPLPAELTGLNFWPIDKDFIQNPKADFLRYLALKMRLKNNPFLVLLDLIRAGLDYLSQLKKNTVYKTF